MEWYDPLVILALIAGFLLAFFGTYHGQGGEAKTGIWGWIIIFFVLVLRAMIWLIEMI